MTGRADVHLLKLEPDVPGSHLAPPFALYYLTAALKRAGFRVTAVHARGTPEALERAVRGVLADRPLFVGISSLTGPSLRPSLAAARRIKALSDVPVVWGGLHPTMLPAETLASPYADVVAVGEGEETAVELARAYADGDGDRLAEIAGIGYKAGGGPRFNPPRPFLPDLDLYAPDWETIDYGPYVYAGRYFYSEMGSSLPGDRIAPFLTSRGCPWRCAYCYNQFVNRRRFRAHTVEASLRGLAILRARYGLTAVVFEDDDLFAARERGLAIVRGAGLPWSASVRADDLVRWGPGFARQIADAGCVEVRIGAESAVPRILELARKDITVEEIRAAVEILRGAGLRALLNFMIGFPGETWSEMGRTFALMDELEDGADGHVVVNGPSVYMPWPGTELYERALALGFLPPAGLEGWSGGWRTRRLPPYVPQAAKFVSHYRILALRRDPARTGFPRLARLLQGLARRRWRARFFRLPLDYYLPKLALGALSKLRPGRGAGGRDG